MTGSDPAEQAAQAECTAMWPRLPIIYLRLTHLYNFVPEKRHTGVGFKLLLRGSKPWLGRPRPFHGQEYDCYCNGQNRCCASTVIKFCLSYGICHTCFGPSIHSVLSNALLHTDLLFFKKWEIISMVSSVQWYDANQPVLHLRKIKYFSPRSRSGPVWSGKPNHFILIWYGPLKIADPVGF